MSFSALGLSAPIVKALNAQDYISPYPIQTAAIPAVLSGKDVLGIAQTGSGKTLSYVLPVLQQVQRSGISKNRHIHTLVLVPTRELAVQVGEVFQLFSRALQEDIKTMSVYGGVSINPQMIKMRGVEILIATPGRLLDLISSKALHLSELQILVLDEADKMLNLGFKEEMEEILSLIPAVRQTLLFSATLSKDLSTITSLVLNEPVVIEVEPEEQHLDLIVQSAYQVEEERKGPLLRYLIKEKDMKQVLVFTSSVFRADAVVDKLKQNGIQAAALHSKKSQGARTDTMRDFKSGKLRVLVATDLASRGIDIKFLPFVINYELPRSPKDYIHRIGRTGRAESSGEAISLVSQEEEHHFKIIQKKMGKQVELINSSDLSLQGY